MRCQHSGIVIYDYSSHETARLDVLSVHLAENNCITINETQWIFTCLFYPIYSLFNSSLRSEVLIEKQWGIKVKRSICDMFWEQVSRHSSKFDVPPVISIGDHYLIHITRNDLFFLTIVSGEVPPLFVLEAHQRIVDTFQTYFRSVSESMMRDTFSLVYQLLDEMVDGGFPFTTEGNQLREMIVPPSLSNRVISVLSSSSSPSSTIKEDLPLAAVGKIPWRKAFVKYVTNEVYFDIIESLDVIIDADQRVVSASVFGEIKARCHLSGTPDLTLSFVRPELLEDCSLHRCVRISRFEKERVASFVPPDGDFTLLTYRVRNLASRIPVYVRPQFTWSRSGAKFSIALGQKMELPKPLTDIVLIMPLPKGCSSAQATANIGVVKVDQFAKTLRWEIPKMPADISPVLEGSLSLTIDAQVEENPVLRLSFEMKKFSATGLGVDGMVVKNVKYTPVRGVRVITQGGRFQVRT